MKPHDEIFRTMASDPHAQRDLLAIALPDIVSQVDLSTLTAVDATFTGGKQADLLLSVQGTDGSPQLIYMLMEHKSYSDPVVAVQLFRYLGAIWQQQWVHQRAADRGSLPVIHPVVFYHGRAPWKTPLHLSALHRHDTRAAVVRDAVASPAGFPANLEYRLVDLRRIRPGKLQVRFRTLAFLITMKYVLRPFGRVTARKLFVVLTDRRIDSVSRVLLFEYLLYNTTKENTTVLLETAGESGYTFEGGKAVMTMAQELIRRGKVEGREEERLEVAQRMLEKGLPIELIMETTNLTREDVAALQEKK